METPPARYKVLFTIIGEPDATYMDVETFDHPPRLGEYVVIGRSEHQTYRIVQVVHSLHQYGYDYAVTGEPSQLSHEAILDSRNSRDGS